MVWLLRTVFVYYCLVVVIFCVIWGCYGIVGLDWLTWTAAILICFISNDFNFLWVSILFFICLRYRIICLYSLIWCIICFRISWISVNWHYSTTTWIICYSWSSRFRTKRQIINFWSSIQCLITNKWIAWHIQNLYTSNRIFALKNLILLFLIIIIIIVCCLISWLTSTWSEKANNLNFRRIQQIRWVNCFCIVAFASNNQSAKWKLIDQGQSCKISTIIIVVVLKIWVRKMKFLNCFMCHWMIWKTCWICC